MNIRQTTIVGVSVSVAAVVIYMVVLGVKPSDITSIGYQAFITASLLAFLRFIVSGVRFHTIARQMDSTDHIHVQGSILIRIASEFVTLISPSYVGGEVLRTAWLTKKGVKLGQAAWATYVEVLYDVVAGSTVSIMAGIYVFQKDALLAGGIVLISSVILSLHLSFTILSVKKKMRMPRFLISLIRHIAGSRRAEMFEELAKTGNAYSEAAGNFMGISSLTLALKVTTFTIMSVILVGLIFWVIGRAAGLAIDPFLSILSVHVAIVIGSIPITPGGSGLSELGISLFTSDTLGSVDWSSVVAWRIVSYYVPLAISSIAFITTMHKEMGKDQSTFQRDWRKTDLPPHPLASSLRRVKAKAIPSTSEGKY